MKTYVLDTSVLVYDPASFKTFKNSNVVIPITVLDELDKLKNQLNETGKNARVAIRLLDELSNKGDICTGFTIEEDIFIRIDSTHYQPIGILGDPSYGDNKILTCAYNMLKHNCVLVSNDINLRVKAKSLGLQAESFNKDKSSLSEMYSGIITSTDTEIGESLKYYGELSCEKFKLNLLPNECIYFQNLDGKGISFGRNVNNKIKLIKSPTVWGLSSRNKEQACAIDLILDKNVDLITLIGKAGSGKTLCALATCLELVVNRKAYKKLVIYRSFEAVGNEIGFLPGSMEEKITPWFQGVMDSFEMLLSNNTKNSNWKKELEMLQNKNLVEFCPLTYIRGRSIPDSIILIEEAQNTCIQDIKTLLTRVGENTKVIITGDIEQIDNRDLDAMNNGLSYVIDEFKHSELAGHVTFIQGERSRLATKAAEIL